jgi:peptidoglycan/LPS O-acetylase OafA/YrhL
MVVDLLSRDGAGSGNIERAQMTTGNSRGRLHFLDGLRGLACLYVLLFHASSAKTTTGGQLSHGMRFLSACIGRGHFSVVFFIVLSGFSIMLPIARAGTNQLNRGLSNYIRRRAIRILPPYYVALILSAALILAYDAISARHGLGAPMADDGLTAGPVFSHLLLLHNLRLDWVYRINSPLWSVATEWQIYFVFAIFLLPLWRWLGGFPTLIIAWLVGSLPFFVLPPNANFFWASPWFVGSFALGMLGAAIGFSPTYQDSWLRTRAPWATLATLGFAAITTLVATGRADSWSTPVIDLIVSLFAFSLINACTERCNWHQGKRSLLLRVFSAPSAVYLGGFSYSLYLIQHPVLRLGEKLVPHFTSDRDLNIQLQLVIVAPITIAVGWLFAELFERPFTSGGIVLPAIRRRSTRRVPVAVSPDP